MNDIRARLLQFVTQAVAVETPELGTVYIRRITLGELDTIQKESAAKPADNTVPIPSSVRLLARFFGDEKGNRVFDLGKPEDVEQLLSFPVSLASRILREGNTVNNMNEEEKETKNA